MALDRTEDRKSLRDDANHQSCAITIIAGVRKSIRPVEFGRPAGSIIMFAHGDGLPKLRMASAHLQLEVASSAKRHPIAISQRNKPQTSQERMTR
jgi:hypothetical protein